MALLASLAWLMPWYVIWLLPLAALGTSLRLRRAAIAFTVFLVLTFIPATARSRSGSCTSTRWTPPSGHASMTLQQKLSQ